MDADVLKALGDENRLAIVSLLSGGELCLCDISGALDISSALASHHVKRLKEAGVVRTRRHGLWLHCSLRHEVFTELADRFRALGVPAEAQRPCCGRLDGGDTDGC